MFVLRIFYEFEDFFRKVVKDFLWSDNGFSTFIRLSVVTDFKMYIKKTHLRSSTQKKNALRYCSFSENVRVRESLEDKQNGFFLLNFSWVLLHKQIHFLFYCLKITKKTQNFYFNQIRKIFLTITNHQH